jgi:UDP-2-acetamido-2-deoxy-ribo-hexuluronate aminotransferase
MSAIKLVDLNNQHARIRSELDEAVKSVMESGLFINGPEVQAFENELGAYLGGPHVVGCANGTDALQLALMTLELPAGSEVIVPDFTFVSTAEVVKQQGLQPKLVEVDSDTFLIDSAAAKRAINSRTRAIMPVHLFGQCAPMEPILDLADTYNLYVVEDVAQALGAQCYCRGAWRPAGTMGTLGATSFFPTKNLGCMGDGGALFTSDESLAHQAKVLRQHGMSAQYQYDNVGINSRLDTIQAAILRVKLANLDQFNSERRQVAEAYDAAFRELPGIQPPEKVSWSTHVYQQYTVKVAAGERESLKSYLGDQEIPAKVFYPTGLHEHAVYQDGKPDQESLSNSLSISKQVLSLPMHTELSQLDIDYIVEAIKAWTAKFDTAKENSIY